ncbi:hypothetical protein Y032_0332g2767 [Ancylostoma ceylanicum]|uniref:Uncharacterized protein n=1 Tax=Ancylostoma ceylanicum TaxID=53326 RepID=A0A016RZX5_9BILA|nr:hypothetical protein Y032_0332g2767 [Ancylostoma ceylanicum]
MRTVHRVSWRDPHTLHGSSRPRVRHTEKGAFVFHVPRVFRAISSLPLSSPSLNVHGNLQQKDFRRPLGGCPSISLRSAGGHLRWLACTSLETTPKDFGPPLGQFERLRSK